MRINKKIIQFEIIKEKRDVELNTDQIVEADPQDKFVYKFSEV